MAIELNSNRYFSRTASSPRSVLDVNDRIIFDFKTSPSTFKPISSQMNTRPSSAPLLREPKEVLSLTGGRYLKLANQTVNLPINDSIGYTQPYTDGTRSQFTKRSRSATGRPERTVSRDGFSTQYRTLFNEDPSGTVNAQTRGPRYAWQTETQTKPQTKPIIPKLDIEKLKKDKQTKNETKLKKETAVVGDTSENHFFRGKTKEMMFLGKTKSGFIKEKTYEKKDILKLITKKLENRRKSDQTLQILKKLGFIRKENGKYSFNAEKLASKSNDEWTPAVLRKELDLNTSILKSNLDDVANTLSAIIQSFLKTSLLVKDAGLTPRGTRVQYLVSDKVCPLKHRRERKVLGEGSFGKVQETYRQNKDGTFSRYVVKTQKTVDLESAQKEANVQRSIGERGLSPRAYQVVETKPGKVVTIMDKAFKFDFKTASFDDFVAIFEKVNALHKKINSPHGDLKPDNIMRDENRELLLIDFGSVVEPESYTPRFMGPSVFQGEVTSKKRDLWALGCMLFDRLRQDQNSYSFVECFSKLKEESAISLDLMKKVKLNPSDKASQSSIYAKLLAFDYEKLVKPQEGTIDAILYDLMSSSPDVTLDSIIEKMKHLEYSEKQFPNPELQSYP